jgi:hypothetical protein
MHVCCLYKREKTTMYRSVGLHFGTLKKDCIDQEGCSYGNENKQDR